MKFLLSACLALLTVSGSAYALLPPLYQTAGEIQAIVSDSQLGSKLQAGEPIIDIRKNSKGYEIITNKHRVQVTFEYKKTARPGPAQYILHFEDPIPLK